MHETGEIHVQNVYHTDKLPLHRYHNSRIIRYRKSGDRNHQFVWCPLLIQCPF